MDLPLENFNPLDVLASCSAHVITVDRELKIQYINYTAEGLTVEQVIGQPILNFSPEEFKKTSEENIRKAINEETNTTYRTQFEAPENKILHFESEVSPLRSNGKVVGAVIIARNITETVHLEKELEERKRKAFFHQSKLANVGSLAAGVGHEVNNPLAIAIGALELLNDKLTDKTQIEWSARIMRALHRIKNISHGLRSFARSDEDKSIAFDLVDLAEKTIELLEQIYAADGVQVKFAAEKRPITIFADPGRIQQVIMNLLVNAKDALAELEKDREVIVEVSEDSDKAVLKVKDNGPGVPKEIQSRVFENFFTTKAIGKGTGMGLNLSATIVSEYGGVIGLDATASPGATFFVELPICESSSNSSKALEEHSTPSAKSRKILVVDDEADIRDILKASLSKQGHVVDVFSSAQSGIEALNKTSYDVIITDVKMPGMSGIEFSRHIKAQNYGSALTIGMTGGVDMDGEIGSQCLETFDSMILKPFTTNQVLEVLSDLENKR